jgi:hypothetical protein
MVQRPALELTHATLPLLSSWGNAMTSTFVCFWLYAVLSCPLAVALQRSTIDLSFVERYCMAATVAGTFFVPILLLYFPASVSTSTISMLNQMNELCVRANVADQCESGLLPSGKAQLNQLKSV